MIFHYKITLQYKGTHYLGWQIQPSHYGKTVQGELENALRVVSKSDEVKTLGSGRTDAGVHALGQVAKVTIPLSIDPRNLIPALNVKLPDDIKIIACEIISEEFHPTFHAISKEYHYHFTADRFHSAIGHEMLANCPFELNLDLMKEACKALVGIHDFINFYTEGTEVSSTVREIFHCDIDVISNSNFDLLPSHYNFKICGNGFLKQMVRLLMGAIWNVGRGKLSLVDFKKALQAPKIQRLGPVAPPEGLYLVRVIY